MSPTHPAARAARDKHQTDAFEDLGLQIPLAEPVRQFAEATTTQAEPVYDLSKYALEGAADEITDTRSTVSRRLIVMSQRSAGSTFELARGLAACRNVADILQVQMAFWSNQMTLLTAQAEDIGELWTALAVRDHAGRRFFSIS